MQALLDGQVRVRVEVEPVVVLASGATDLVFLENDLDVQHFLEFFGSVLLHFHGKHARMDEQGFDSVSVRDFGFMAFREPYADCSFGNLGAWAVEFELQFAQGVHDTGVDLVVWPSVFVPFRLVFEHEYIQVPFVLVHARQFLNDFGWDSVFFHPF